MAVAAARGKDVDTAAGVGAAAGGGASGPSSSRRSSSSRSRDEGGEGVRASASGADMVGRAWATRRSPFSFEAQRVPGSAARGQHRSSHRHSLYLRTAQFTVRPFFSHHAFSPHRIHQGPFSLGQKSESSGLRGPLPPFLAWYHYDRDERRRRSSIPVSNSTLALLFALSLSPLRDSSREAELWRILCRILVPPRPPPPHSMICLRTQQRRTMNEALLDTPSPSPFPFSLSPSHSLFLLFLSFLRALPDRPT